MSFFLLLFTVLGSIVHGDAPFVVGSEMEVPLQECLSVRGDDTGKGVRLESIAINGATIAVVYSHSGTQVVWVDLSHPKHTKPDGNLAGSFAWESDPEIKDAGLKKWVNRTLKGCSKSFKWTQRGESPSVVEHELNGDMTKVDLETLLELKDIFLEATKTASGSDDWQHRLGRALSRGDLHPRVLYFAAANLSALGLSNNMDSTMFLYKRALAQVEPYMRITSGSSIRTRLELIRSGSLLALGETKKGLKYLDKYVDARAEDESFQVCSIIHVLERAVGRGDHLQFQSWLNRYLSDHPQCVDLVLLRVQDRVSNPKQIPVTKANHPLEQLEAALLLHYQEEYDSSIAILLDLPSSPLTVAHLALGHYRAGRPLEAQRWVDTLPLEQASQLTNYTSALVQRNSSHEAARRRLDTLLKEDWTADNSSPIRVYASRLSYALEMMREAGARGEPIRAIGDPQADRFGEPLGSPALAKNALQLIQPRPRKVVEKSHASSEKKQVEPKAPRIDAAIVKAPERSPEPVDSSGSDLPRRAAWLLLTLISFWAFLAWFFKLRSNHTSVGDQAD